MGKSFPLRQGVACQLKWTWNTIRLAEATSACCHHVDPIALDLDDFENFHNYPQWVQHREMQLAGKFPQQGCQYCGDIEAEGGVSDRMLHLEEEDIYPPELDADPVATKVTPRILEVFINNVCNMACIYCDESNSSRIQQENRKFGYRIEGVPFQSNDRNIIPIVPRHQEFPEIVDKFFVYLDQAWSTLRRLNVLGGEPFYQREFFRLLEFIEQHNNADLKLTVVTNLMVDPGILQDFIQRMKRCLVSKKIQRLDIMASLDCWGPEQEYVRYGLDLDQWQKNFELLCEHRWIFVNVHNTINALTIKTMPFLLDYINQHRQHRKIYHSFGLVQIRPQLHPGIFGPGFFAGDFAKVLERMTGIDIWSQRNREYLQGIIKVIDNHGEDMLQQQYLRLFLDEIDRRRGLDWSSVFPWLAKHLEEKSHVV